MTEPPNTEARPTLPLWDSSKIVPLFAVRVRRHKHRPGWAFRLTIFRRFLEVNWFGR